jgi:NADH-quinone oxidoreductase subunit G
MINLIVDNVPVTVPDGATILDAARQANITIPTLCHLDLGPVENHVASCRICVVEVEGRPNLAASCATPVAEGMRVTTNSRRVLDTRRKVLQLLLSDHPLDCLACAKSTSCQLQQLVWELGVDPKHYRGARSSHPIDQINGAIRREPDKCIMCRRCETMCNEVQTVGALTGYGRGFTATVAPAEMLPLDCTFCGQCVNVCPTGALTEVENIPDVWSALFDDTKRVVVQVAPAVRVAIGEEFGLPPGHALTRAVATGLRRLGFDAVFDTTFGADLTIVEEAHEIVGRLTAGENLPLFTSCCPAWMTFLRTKYPHLLGSASSCKSPQQMMGAVSKSFYADRVGVAREDIVMVAVMPCVAKKVEASFTSAPGTDPRDVDHVLTTRELAKMFKEAGIDLPSMPGEGFDDPLGLSTGAGVIFGATGGVLEAALRTIYEEVTGQELTDVEFAAVRGLDGVKEAAVTVGGRTVRVAAVSGLGNARKVLDGITAGTMTYDVVEVMACPGGCINGGGQPYSTDRAGTIRARMEGLYALDENAPLRTSHKNPAVQRLYSEFLGTPGGHQAHALLHASHSTAKEDCTCEAL